MFYINVLSYVLKMDMHFKSLVKSYYICSFFMYELRDLLLCESNFV
jgi:hypothetical protein